MYNRLQARERSVCYKPMLGRERAGATAPGAPGPTQNLEVLCFHPSGCRPPPRPPCTHPEEFLAPLPAALGSGWYEEDPGHAGRKWACPGPHHLHRPHCFGAAYSSNGWRFLFFTSLLCISSLTLNKGNCCPTPRQMWERSCAFSISKTILFPPICTAPLSLEDPCSHMSSCWILIRLAKVIIVMTEPTTCQDHVVTHRIHSPCFHFTGEKKKKKGKGGFGNWLKVT